jgi:hypothetical protein
MRSLTKDLSGWLGNGAPLGYPARQERVDYVGDYPQRSRRTKDTQPRLTQQGERVMSGLRPPRA